MNFADLGYLRVAAASTEVALANPKANVDAVLAAAHALAADGVSIACFPELCLSGYSTEDLFFSDTLEADVRAGLAQLAADNPLPALIVGTPWRLADGRLLNCAAVISAGRLRGLIPKTAHPNYGEFYDLRWFASGAGVNEVEIDADLGQFPVRCDQLFAVGDHRFGIEICEDLWAPHAPSTDACLAGAEIIFNLSASNELIAKADYRTELVRMASAKNICAYVYASAGPTESTKDVVFGGHCLIMEDGVPLAASSRFDFAAHHIVADIDTAKLRHDRKQNTTFRQARRPPPYRTQRCEAPLALAALERTIARHPFVPSDESEFDARAQEILSIQTTGLARRMRAARCDKLVIGLSGGLDSTLALLVCLDAVDKQGVDRNSVHALTMPGPGTSAHTLDNARKLARAGAVTLQEISIDKAVAQHLEDLDHGGDHDIVFENAQARERTQILFNYANKVGGIVVGTGDLSELALGWCTYNADHMASYNVNASVPKTMMAYLVRWYGNHRASQALGEVLKSVLDTPISPELIPPQAGEISQHTEDIVGPYELHDFFLYHFLRNGAGPAKIFHLACIAFGGDYDRNTIKHWLGQFFRRFFSQQFKRTTLPPGPKVGSVSLSPRGDWRMPDEADAEQILADIDQL